MTEAAAVEPTSAQPTAPPVATLTKAQDDALKREMRKVLGNMAGSGEVSKGDAEVVADVYEKQLDGRDEIVDADLFQRAAGRSAHSRYMTETRGSYPIAQAYTKAYHGWRDNRRLEDIAESVQKYFREDAGIPDYAAKTLQAGVTADGGILIQGELVRDFYGPLVESTAVLSLNPRRREIPKGSTVSLAGMASRPSGTWVGEQNTQDVSGSPTYDDRMLEEKWLMLLVAYSNVFAASAPGRGTLSDLENHIRDQFALDFDSVWLTGAGTSHRPRGLVTRAEDAGNTATSAGATTPNKFTDLTTALLHFANNNVPMNRMGVVMPMRSLINLTWGTRNTEELLVFRDEIAAGTWGGAKIGATNLMPTNFGGTNTKHLWADFSEVVVGTGDAIEMRRFEEGSATIAGTVVRPIEQRVALIRALGSTDINILHDESAYTTTAIAY